jgi:hypothetical protein
MVCGAAGVVGISMRAIGFFGALLVGTLSVGCNASSSDGGGEPSVSDAAALGDGASVASDGGVPRPDGSDVVDADGVGSAEADAPEASTASGPGADLIFKLVPPATSFDVQTTVVSSGLPSSVVMLASQGYVVTASTPLAAGSQLWAFRPTGSTQAYDVQATVVSSGLPSSVVMLASQGYVVTASTPLAAGSQLWAFSHAR